MYPDKIIHCLTSISWQASFNGLKDQSRTSSDVTLHHKNDGEQGETTPEAMPNVDHNSRLVCSRTLAIS